MVYDTKNLENMGRSSLTLINSAFNLDGSLGTMG